MSDLTFSAGGFSHYTRARILVQVTIYRRLLIGRDGHLDNQKPTIYRNLYENTDPGVHITKNPNFDPISTFSYFHYKS